MDGITNQAADPAIRAAAANAFLFRCTGIADLALAYLRDSLKLAAQSEGKPPPSSPPRGSGERILDWLDAARAAGLETAAHRMLRDACAVVPADPPPLDGTIGLAPASAEGDIAEAATTAVKVGAELHVRNALEPAVAIYWFALLMDADNAMAHYNLAVLNIAWKNWDEAIRHLDQVLAADPTSAGALQALHNVAIQGGRMASLAPHLARLVQIREKPSPVPGSDDDAAPPIIVLDPANGEEVSALVENRGVAHVRAATIVSACAEVLRRAEALFEGNEHLLSLRLIDVFPEAWNMDSILAPGMAAALTRIFGRAPALSETDSFVRRVFPRKEDTYIPFHQDVTALAKTGVNVWVPLVDCGLDAPGLELMARRTTRILPTVASAGDYDQTEIAADLVYAEFPPDVRFYPAPSIGDAVLFLGSTVHRSHVAADMTRGRISVEMRYY